MEMLVHSIYHQYLWQLLTQKIVLIFIVKGDFISKPYVDMTLDLMKKFNVNVNYDRAEKSFHIEPQMYRSIDYYC